MNAKIWTLIVLSIFAVTGRAQESVRDLSGPGQNNKFLTPGQVDRWIFEGEKGETIIAHVVSREFDPILELAQGVGNDHKLLQEADDPGSESIFSMRLPEKGKYEIRIHAFKYQGGGNYSLRVQRFLANPLTVGKPLIGAFDREGKSFLYFSAAKDQILIPDLKGASSDALKMLDLKGREMVSWADAVHVQDNGECSLVVSGHPQQRYGLLVREARRQELAVGRDLADKLQQGELTVWSFEGKPGDFRLIEVDKQGELLSRLIYSPTVKKSEQRLARPGDRPELEFLPVASGRGRLRFAAMLGRAGRYQLQLLAQSPAVYKVNMRDRSVPIEWGAEVQGNLPVGGAAFYSFQAAPGRLFQAGLSSHQFVPVLRLYDSHGRLANQSGNDADALEGRLTHMVVTEGLYRLEVSSLGDGGGGDFRLALKETKLKELQVGGRGQGAIQPGAIDFWAFEGKEGQTVFLSIRSASFESMVSIRNPNGVLLAADNKGNAATGSLFALKLAKAGRYTVWIASRRGAGEYAVRLIDGD